MCRVIKGRASPLLTVQMNVRLRERILNKTTGKEEDEGLKVQIYQRELSLSLSLSLSPPPTSLDHSAARCLSLHLFLRTRADVHLFVLESAALTHSEVRTKILSSFSLFLFIPDSLPFLSSSSPPPFSLLSSLPHFDSHVWGWGERKSLINAGSFSLKLNLNVFDFLAVTEAGVKLCFCFSRWLQVKYHFICKTFGKIKK